MLPKPRHVANNWPFMRFKATACCFASLFLPKRMIRYSKTIVCTKLEQFVAQITACRSFIFVFPKNGCQEAQSLAQRSQRQEDCGFWKRLEQFAQHHFLSAIPYCLKWACRWHLLQNGTVGTLAAKNHFLLMLDLEALAVHSRVFVHGAG